MMKRATKSDPIPAPRQKRWRQRYLLTMLGIVFAVSAVLRVGSLEFAVAQAAGDEARSGAISASMSATDAGLTDALRAALAEIDDLRAQLGLREAEIADRERALAAAQTLVEDRLVELEAAETRLAALIATSDQAAETDLDQLTRVYEVMDPKIAAALFDQMPPSFAAGFLARMTPPTSAALLAEVSREQAYAISVILATRNSSAPRFEPSDRIADTDG
jgi:flagellar motility protein MotE (MotC chaperone)